MTDIVRILIIIILIYYLVKGLLYLLFWQAALRTEARGMEIKRKRMEARERIKQRRAREKNQDE
jgi:predicted Holliday junction resolvase-like endonuclease